jgi:hypothetical protein
VGRIDSGVEKNRFLDTRADQHGLQHAEVDRRHSLRRQLGQLVVEAYFCYVPRARCLVAASVGPYQGARAAMASILETMVSALVGGRAEKRQGGVCERLQGSAGPAVVNMDRLSAWIRDFGVLRHCSSVVTLSRRAVLAAGVRTRCQIGLLDALSGAW